ncbi:type II secretion system protein [Patescibacteria group bacterium]|nr:type II secretion system protein [Patescibacteria group bacterium]
MPHVQTRTLSRVREVSESMKAVQQKGFTLIELLVVIGIVAILATIVLVAINPARQFATARDTARRNDVYQILNAVHQYAVDNGGQYPTQIETNNWIDIGTGGLNLTADLVSTYIPAIPVDPQTGDDATTNYVLARESDGRLTATASSAEVTTPLTITR